MGRKTPANLLLSELPPPSHRIRLHLLETGTPNMNLELTEPKCSNDSQMTADALYAELQATLRKWLS